MKFLHTCIIVLACILFMACGFLLAAWLQEGVQLWYAVVCGVMAAALMMWAWDTSDLDLAMAEETAEEIARQRNQARAEAARLEMQLQSAQQSMKRARLLNCHAGWPLLLMSTTDATYYSVWDKVGAVAVCMVMLVVVVRLHQTGLNRVDAISERHMTFVEKLTEILTELHSSNEDVVKITQTLHRRLDAMLACHKPACPLKAFQAASNEDVTLHSKPQTPPLPS